MCSCRLENGVLTPKHVAGLIQQLGNVDVQTSNHIIVYPRDSTKDLGRAGRGANHKLSPCPNGKSFCEDANDYPQEYINKKMRKQPHVLLGFLNEEKLLVPAVKAKSQQEWEEEPICPASTDVVFPKKGKSKEGSFEFIVNDNQYKQGVLIEVCRNDGGECSIPGSLSFGYSSRCVQKYIQRILVVFNQNSPVEEFVTKIFEFPSSCACQIIMSLQ